MSIISRQAQREADAAMLVLISFGAHEGPTCRCVTSARRIHSAAAHTSYKFFASYKLSNVGCAPHAERVG